MTKHFFSLVTRKSNVNHTTLSNTKLTQRFFLSGRLIFGPDVRSFLLTVALIVVPGIIFCKYVARDLLERFPKYLGITIMVVAVALTLTVLFLLFLTSARDPGIIPRNKHPPEPEEDFDLSNLEFLEGQTPHFRLPKTKDVIVNGVAVKQKYCETCMIYRPPRCSHCSICNNCVERFDHHCPWVGQCIGQRNYISFVMFVSMTTILCIYVLAMSTILIKKLTDAKDHSVWKAVANSPASIALIIYTFCAIWFVGGLTLFHLYLISKNQTTYENFRYRYDKKVNPYDMGPRHNFQERFCGSIPPSHNHFRATVEEQDLPTYVFGTLEDLNKLGSHLNQDNMKHSGDVELSISITNIGTNEGNQNSVHVLGYPVPAERNEIYFSESNWSPKIEGWDADPEMMTLAERISRGRVHEDEIYRYNVSFDS